MGVTAATSEQPSATNVDPHPHDGSDDHRAVGRSWARPVGALAITVFVAYHVTYLLVSNLPAKGPTRGVHWVFNRYAHMAIYGRLTETPQNWGLFGPNPPRSNKYTRVLVTDQAGVVTDLRHDTYGRQEYPHLRFDYMRKVNRRLFDERPLQLGYAAWVCRWWERTHGGQAALEVRLVPFSTRIPPPSGGYAAMNYDPLRLPVTEGEMERHACATLAHARLPPYLRRRLGLPVVPGEAVRSATSRDDRRTSE